MQALLSSRRVKLTFLSFIYGSCSSYYILFTQDVEGVLGLAVSTSSSYLSIYRWGQQVVDLPHDHPALPVTLQMYLTLHLARVPPRPGYVYCWIPD